MKLIALIEELVNKNLFLLTDKKISDNIKVLICEMLSATMIDVWKYIRKAPLFCENKNPATGLGDGVLG